MAFKTDTIKLKLLSNDNQADEVNGELAVVNNTLRLRTGGTWADVSGGGGSLNNVVEDTTPQLGGDLDANGNDIDMGTNVITDVKVGQWDTAAGWGNHLLGGYLTSETFTSLVQDTTPELGGELLANGNDIDMGVNTITDAKVGNWDTAYGWGNHSTQSYVTNDTHVQTTALAANVTIGTTLNQKFVITSDPSTYSFRFNNPASGYTADTIIEIINHSQFDQIISTGTTHNMHLTNTGVQGTADITVEKGQRALCLPDPAANVFYISILSA